VQPGPRFQLAAGEMTPPFVLPGNRIITIYDDPRVNPNVRLYQDTFAAGLPDLSLSVVPDAGRRVKVVQLPQPAR
jgi:hypothetical protein